MDRTGTASALQSREEDITLSKPLPVIKLISSVNALEKGVLGTGSVSQGGLTSG